MRALVELLGTIRAFVVTVPLVYLSTILMGTLSLLCSLVDSGGRMQHACARWWSRGLLFFARVSVRVSGREHLQPGRTYVYASNHASYMDVPVIFAYLPANFRIMAKSSLFHIPFLGWHLRRSGHMPVDQGNPRRAARSLLGAAEHVKQGTPVFIFPEGARSPSGLLEEFKPGTFLLAIKSGAPVVPITLNGVRDVLPMNSWRLRPGRVEMIFHPPIPTAGMHTDDAAQLAAAVRAAIASAYRAGPPGTCG
jgi:1-acyl-sn-glycerol-3-phosphate acyltransferase